MKNKDQHTSAVRHAPLSEVVEQNLAKRILSGKWEEGFRLPSEGKLCEEFGVSRTAVREALRELRGRGIIETINGSGSYVAGGNLEMVSKAMEAYSSLTTDERAAEDLIEFRSLIEGAAVGRLARSTRNKQERLQRLKDILAEMLVVGSEDTVAFARLDSAFHLIILETCNNAFINMIGKALHVHYKRYIGDAHATAPEGMREETLAEHAAIIDAIELGDGDAAREALEGHLSAAAARADVG